MEAGDGRLETLMGLASGDGRGDRLSVRTRGLRYKEGRSQTPHGVRHIRLRIHLLIRSYVRMVHVGLACSQVHTHATGDQFIRMLLSFALGLSYVVVIPHIRVIRAHGCRCRCSRSHRHRQVSHMARALAVKRGG